MRIDRLRNLSEENDVCNNRVALALTLLLSSCAPSVQQQPPETPDPVVVAPDNTKELKEFLNGNSEIQVNIPAGDNTKESLADFIQFCESRGIQYELGQHNNEGDLMKVENIFTLCRPEGEYSITVKNEGGTLKVQKVSTENNPVPNSDNKIALNELLRTIMQYSWMLEAIKQNNLEAGGSVASATIPEDKIPEDQIRGEPIDGYPGFIMEKMRFKINCETGAHEPDFSGYPRKVCDNGSSVFIEYDNKGDFYRISYGGSLGGVLIAR